MVLEKLGPGRNDLKCKTRSILFFFIRKIPPHAPHAPQKGIDIYIDLLIYILLNKIIQER